MKIKAAKTKRQADKLHIDLLDHRESTLSKALTQNYKFVTGHVRCSSATRELFEDQWNFITLLRHPVNRWFSHYFFNASKKGSHFATGMTIQEYLDSTSGRNIGSLYVQYFTKDQKLDPLKRIDEAIENLKKFKLVGVLENLEGFKESYHQYFGLPIEIKRKNLNPTEKSVMKDQITDEIRVQVEEICQPDLKVYHAIQSTLE